MSVNRPTDTKVKEQDINQKLQLYGIFTAFSNGKVPSNKQIDVALNSALASTPLANPSSKLSEEGRHLVADLKEVIRQAKYLLLTKNEGNLLQEFIWNTQQLSGGNAQLPNAPVDKQTAQQHGNEALEGLRTLGTLIVSNGQFRKLLSDATILLRDMAGDAAQNAATKINPSDEKLGQIDQPAEDNTWHEVPKISDLKAQARDQYNKQKPFGKSDLQSAADQGVRSGAGTSDPNELANQDPNSVDPQAGASTAASNLRETASQNVPDETKDNIRDARDTARLKTKNYLREKMPQERRDQTIWRLKKMVVEVQGHSDYQQAIETLLNLAETYAGHGKNVSQQGAGTVKGAHEDDALKNAETNLLTLIERFANSTSTDDLFEAINNIYRDADRDPELKDWFKSMDRYIRKCLREQGFILQDEANDEWNQLYDKGHFLLRERYRDHTNRILDEVKFLGNQFDEDPMNKSFGLAVQKLFTDLGNDENGKPTFKKHLVQDLTNVILPAIFENVRYVPIPRIEVSDPQIDAVVENLVIESDNLMPNVFEFGSDNYFRWGRKKISNKHDNKLMISASGIQMDLRDVSYYIKKKQGFPSVTDTGLMDIYLGGEGFSFKIAASTAHKKDRNHYAKVDSVSVNIKHMNIKLKQSNHKLLFAIAKPLLLKVMRPAIQKVMEKQIRDAFDKGDQYAWEIHQEAEKVATAAKEDPENAPNIYARYADAIRARATEKKQKAEQVASNTKVNMAVTKHDSIFKNINLPGGISTKATEYKELAAKGERWESPVFGIGSASPSSDVPKLAPISRKPHNATSGTIRGSGIHSNEPSATGGAQPPAGPPVGSTGTTTGATTGFSNQVDQAFQGQGEKYEDVTNGPVTNGTARV